MYKVDKSKKIIIGTELNDYESSCSENEYPTDDSDVEINVKPSKTEEIKGHFTFLCHKKGTKVTKNKLTPEVYIDENV